MRLKLMIVGLAIFLSGGFYLYQMLDNWSPRSKTISVERGNAIIKALDKYYSEKRKFPSKLTDLVPAYLPSIPEPTAGLRKWTYFVEDDFQIFSLQFSQSKYASSVNYCSSPEWRKVGWYVDN